ncbi:MAG: hypothetical protein LBJ02_10840 [Bifidobacteriaceae bacterium]|jgi:hypothetical protein|nr:hypothetical protein [Bifidobacteriaceae bacterium]
MVKTVPQLTLWAVFVDKDGDSTSDSNPGSQIPKEVAGLKVRAVGLKAGTSQEDRIGQLAGELAAEWEAHPDRVVVAWAVDRPTGVSLAGLDLTTGNLLAVSSQVAAEGAIRALLAGRSVASLVYPPLFTPAKALEQAGLGPAADGERWRIRVTQEPRDQWLEITAEGVSVSAEGLTPLERAAIEERTGPLKATGPGAGRHLLIGSANWAGQGRAWAQAVGDHIPGFTAWNYQLRMARGIVFDSDCMVPIEDFHSPVVRADLALNLIAPASHILVEDLRLLTGQGSLRDGHTMGRLARSEWRVLRDSGRRVAVLLHGTIARDPAIHRSLYPWSPYWDEGSSAFKDQMALVQNTAAALAELEVPLFTATLDMLDYLDNARWLPIVASPADFAPAPPWAAGGKLRVAHAPSSGLLKGSEFVDALLSRLAQQGVIEYVPVRGVAPELMPGLLRQVDVVVDQVVLGNPATLLIQTMAAGRLGVAHVSGRVRRRFPAELPVVEADPSSITEVIASIAADPDSYRHLAEAGPVFARRFHDGRLSAAVLDQHFLSDGGES